MRMAGRITFRRKPTGPTTHPPCIQRRSACWRSSGSRTRPNGIFVYTSLARGQTKTSVGVLRIHQCCLRFGSPGHALYRRMHSMTRITAHSGAIISRSVWWYGDALSRWLSAAEADPVSFRRQTPWQSQISLKTVLVSAIDKILNSLEKFKGSLKLGGYMLPFVKCWVARFTLTAYNVLILNYKHDFTVKIQVATLH